MCKHLLRETIEKNTSTVAYLLIPLLRLFAHALQSVLKRCPSFCFLGLLLIFNKAFVNTVGVTARFPQMLTGNSQKLSFKITKISLKFPRLDFTQCCTLLTIYLFALSIAF